MKKHFAGQVPKDLLFPNDIEDKMHLLIDKGLIAISDGASESFDSKTWASLLTSKFINDNIIDESWLNDIIIEYNLKFDFKNMSWSKQAAFNRGSFATFLGVAFIQQNNTINVVSIGDSIAVLLNGINFVDSFPYRYVEEFHNNPKLFSTKSTLNTFFASQNLLPEHHKEWQIKNIESPILLCMTDSLGEWALNNIQEHSNVWKRLLEINTLTELEELVIKERKYKNLRIDDITLVILKF